MDYAALFERIVEQVDEQAYLPLADVVDPDQEHSMKAIEDSIRDPAQTAQAIEQMICEFHSVGAIDKVHMLSALHVLAASPKLNNLDLAARYATEQEMAAMAMGGPRLQANLASVDRHRGVLAYLQGHYGVALDYFSRAFERQHTAGNLSNVLATLIRLGDISEARQLADQVNATLSRDLIDDLNHIIAQDPDLALLRPEATR